MKMVIITRHPALIEHIRQTMPDVADAEVLTHVDDPDQVRYAHVIGVLPLHLAAEADLITEIPLALDLHDRGKELSLERLREIAGEPRTYTVRFMGTLAAGEPKLIEDQDER